MYSARNIEYVEGMAEVVATEGAFKPNVPSRRCQESTQRFIARVLVTRSSEKKCLPESQFDNRNKMRSTFLRLEKNIGCEYRIRQARLATATPSRASLVLAVHRSAWSSKFFERKKGSQRSFEKG